MTGEEILFQEWLYWNDYNLIDLDCPQLADLWDQFYAETRESEENGSKQENSSCEYSY